MNISFKLLENNSQISNLILQSLVPQLNDYLKNKLQYIRTNLSPLLNNALINSPEYDSLVNGQLKYEFGIPDPQTKLNEILNIWTKNPYIEYKPPMIISSKIKASFSVSLVRSDFSDVLSTDASLVVDRLRGYNLSWLEWLLLEGNRTIIPKQEVIIGPNKFSRTGNAVMRQSSKSWKVPSQYAGTMRDNWITRAIDSAQDNINSLLEKAFS